MVKKKRIRNFVVREIDAIWPSEEHKNKALIFFTDRTTTYRRIYRKRRTRYIIYNYQYYKLMLNVSGTYDYVIIGDIERKELGIVEPVVDEPTWSREPEDEPKDEPEDEPKDGYDPNAKHYAYDDILAMVKADVPVYLHGPAGCGKNYTIKMIAGELGLNFYFTNSIQEYYKLTGFIDGNGRFHETEFYKAFTQGGLFFLDELDASIPEALILLNAAIANRYFSFPTGQVDAHPDFRVIAAGNTAGSGADEMYTGRSVIDVSSLDRFAFIEFGYDRNVELAIAEGDSELVDFVRECRNVATDNGIRVAFTYRAIEQTVALAKAGLELNKIMKYAIFKGLSIDDINMFNVWGDNKYSRTLRAVQRG